MIPPEHQSNNIHRDDIKDILDEFSKKFQWRTDGLDTMLDIGCGTGDIAVNLLMPLLPKAFSKLTGCDRSDENIAYATDKHKEYFPKVTFNTFDYGCTNSMAKEYLTKNKYYFDHITSFYCLHWIPNQKNLMQNIYDMLRGPSSDCLLVIVGNNPIFESYRILSKSPKWSMYMEDVDEYIPIYHSAQDTVKELDSWLQAIGFHDCKIDVKQKHYAFDGYEVCKGLVKNINPFWTRIPDDQQEEYISEFATSVVNVAKSTANEQNFPNNDENKIIFLYKLIVVYAKK